MRSTFGRCRQRQAIARDFSDCVSSDANRPRKVRSGGRGGGWHSSRQSRGRCRVWNSDDVPSERFGASGSRLHHRHSGRSARRHRCAEVTTPPSLVRENAAPFLDVTVNPALWTALVPAAGRGSRLDFDQPKVLFPIAGKTILEWLVDLLRPLCSQFAFVVSPQGEQAVAAGTARIVTRGSANP